MDTSGLPPGGWKGVNSNEPKANSRYQPAAQAPSNEEDDYWRTKRLSPSRIQVRDISIDHVSRSPGRSSSVAPEGHLSCDDADLPNLGRVAKQHDDEIVKLNEGLPPMIAWEKSRINSLLEEFGWMKGLRVDNPSSDWRCRWVHVPSTSPRYLKGVLLGMSKDQSAAIQNCRVLDECITQNERFSRHGKYFSPFFKQFPESCGKDQSPPLLITFPFLDWTVHPGPVPEPRFHVDPQPSQKYLFHPIRSMLQYYYRLEDTEDRERIQVYSSHLPWLNDPTLLSKVERWYGQLPTGLAVDEMWILVIDAQHIVTFSSNQTWKPLWPAHQIPNRIAEISFRRLRNSFQVKGHQETYDAYIHMIACLDGAVGLLHWSSWPDIVLCLTDRFGGYLNHLQYRLHRSPSTKLVMDLLQIQDELGIVIDVTRKQWELIHQLRESIVPQRTSDSFSHVVANLDREYSDLRDLRDNCNNLVTRTVQLVNIRLEDHGKAILVFTIVTIVFLPLSFVASFFGMNTKDIRELSQGQWVFWAVAVTLTAVVVGGATILAFYGGSLVERFFEIKGEHQHGAKLGPKKKGPKSHAARFT